MTCFHSGFCNPEVAIVCARTPYPEAAYTVLSQLRSQATECLEAWEAGEHDTERTTP